MSETHQPKNDPAAPTGVRDPVLLRLALGYVFLHFGALKFFADFSTAEWIAEYTVLQLSWFKLPPVFALRALAVLECVIGLGFLLKIWLKPVTLLFFFHMCATFLPLWFLPEYVFRVPPFGLTFEGQYVLKNLVFLAAGWSLLIPYVFPSRSRKNRAAIVPTSHPSPSS